MTNFFDFPAVRRLLAIGLPFCVLACAIALPAHAAGAHATANSGTSAGLAVLGTAVVWILVFRRSR